MKYKKGGAFFNDDETIEIPTGAILFERSLKYDFKEWEENGKRFVQRRLRPCLEWMEPVKA